MYPSEYAYHQDSVRNYENASANCRNYPPDNLQGDDHPEYYIHCDGTQLQLADSNFRQQQYRDKDYYEWNANKDGQLLFIFPTRVSLTTITLHYYRDNFRSLPRLRFFVVPDGFNIWNATTTDTPCVDVAAVSPGGKAGCRNVSICVNFETKKVVMYKYSSNFRLQLSEVQFFNCSCKCIYMHVYIITGHLESNYQSRYHQYTATSRNMPNYYCLHKKYGRTR